MALAALPGQVFLQRQWLGSSSGVSSLPWCEWQQDVAAADGQGEQLPVCKD